MNIIFIDIDGPLLPGKMHLFPENRLSGKENHPLFDPWAVRCINLWAKYGEAQAVFSTSWRMSYTVDELIAIMEHNGLDLDYHEDPITPYRWSDSRGHQIREWLDDNDCDRYIAVDDDYSCQGLQQMLEEGDFDSTAKGDWIEVDFSNGISYKNFHDGCKVLGIDLTDLYKHEFDHVPLTQEQLDNLANSLV